MASAPTSSLAAWHALERAVDRWASLGALALAFVAAFAYLVLV